jgi:8-oxo-dGDP phosphatase
VSAEPVDQPERWPVTASKELVAPGFVGLRRDTVTGPDGDTFDRDVVLHDDAVGVVVLDPDDRVLLLGQYRHAVGHRLLELPAGLLDVPGEDPWEAAVRELAEEAELQAADWRLLVDAFSSPGFATESWRIYLARDVSPVSPGADFEREHEEAHLTEHWIPLDDAVQAILRGRLTDAMAVIGLLAVHTARADGGLDTLRAPDAAWVHRAPPAPR